MDDLKSVISESLPDNVTPESLPEDVNKDVEADSSEAVPVETPTPKVEQKELPFHQHPRWKEVMDDKRRAEERAERLEQKLYELSSKAMTRDEKDPYDGLTPEEKAFWSRVETIADKRAAAKVAEKEALFNREIQENKMLVTGLMYERFQQKHPDIVSGSDEENLIASKVRSGYSLEDAYLIVTAPKRIKDAEETARKKYETDVKTKNKTKLAANLEGPGIPPESPVQGNKPVTIRDIVERHIAGKSAA